MEEECALISLLPSALTHLLLVNTLVPDQHQENGGRAVNVVVVLLMALMEEDAVLHHIDVVAHLHTEVEDVDHHHLLITTGVIVNSLVEVVRRTIAADDVHHHQQDIITTTVVEVHHRQDVDHRHLHIDLQRTQYEKQLLWYWTLSKVARLG